MCVADLDTMSVSSKAKSPQSPEDQFDSGLGSLREDEDEEEARKQMDSMSISAIHQEERWKLQLTEDLDTLLHLAVIHEEEEVALRMIARARDERFLNAQNSQRQTALHLAVVTEQPQTVSMLLRAGCDPLLVDDRGDTALHVACRMGSLACFGVLTQGCPHKLPAVLRSINYSGLSCLHVACIHGYLSLVESLVTLGANINAQEHRSGRTALHLAVDLQNQQLVALLLALGADVNSMTYGGFSACQLTYGQQDGNIRRQLYGLTTAVLRELPDSDGEEEEESGDEQMYDDILLMA